jgi:hypothetical protein
VQNFTLQSGIATFFGKEAMVLGTGLFALLLIGAPQEPPRVAPPPDDGMGTDFIVFKESLLDDWDLDGVGGGSGGVKKYWKCRIENNISPAGKSVVHWTRKSDGVTDKTKHMSKQETVKWKNDNCD